MKKYSIALLFVLGACANMSTLQTAETLEKGQGEFAVGLGYVSHKTLNVNSQDTKVTAPYVEMQYRRGFLENLDAGAKLTLIGTGGLDVKYQIVDQEKFDLAVGTSLAYLTVGGGSDDLESSNKIVILDWTLPVYLSSPVSDSVTLYASPKYMLRMVSRQSALNILGASVGVKWGQNSGVMLETSYGKGLGSDFSSLQFNGAVFFKGDAWL